MWIRNCEVMTQLELENGKHTWEVERSDNVERSVEKGNKGAELTVAMFQYFRTAFVF